MGYGLNFVYLEAKDRDWLKIDYDLPLNNKKRNNESPHLNVNNKQLTHFINVLKDSI